jgi:hypothetical protein
MTKDDIQYWLNQFRQLPTVKAREIDGEESDGTPISWRDRPFVSLTRLERLLNAQPQAEPSSATVPSEFPPLPFACRYMSNEPVERFGGTVTAYYTAEQMRAYALAALAAQPQAEPSSATVPTDEQLIAWLAEAQGKKWGTLAQTKYVLEKARAVLALAAPAVQPRPLGYGGPRSLMSDAPAVQAAAEDHVEDEVCVGPCGICDDVPAAQSAEPQEATFNCVLDLGETIAPAATFRLSPRARYFEDERGSCDTFMWWRNSHDRRYWSVDSSLELDRFLPGGGMYALAVVDDFGVLVATSVRVRGAY